MQDPKPFNPVQPPAVGPARFTWPGLWLAVLAAPVVGLVWARIGQVVQSYFAPAVLFPVLVGVFTGLTVVGLVRLARIGHRPTILLAAALAAAVAAAGQHGFSCLAWLSWAIDALLLVAAAAAVTIPAVRVPYCNQCRSWYRTVRNGKIDLPTAGRLAGLLEVEPPERPRSARYRLSACQGGCGPSRCELSWEHGGGVDLVRTWLDVQKRNEVAAILDGLANENDLENDEARMTSDQ